MRDKRPSLCLEDWVVPLDRFYETKDEYPDFTQAYICSAEGSTTEYVVIPVRTRQEAEYVIDTYGHAGILYEIVDMYTDERAENISDDLPP